MDRILAVDKESGLLVSIKPRAFRKEYHLKYVPPTETPVVEAPVEPVALHCEECKQDFKRPQDVKSHNTRYHS